MPNQIESKDGIPRKDNDRPSPDVDKDAVDGQSRGRAEGDAGYKGDGPGKIGLNSDAQPDLVAPSGVNQRDHGSAEDKPMGGGALNFEDGESGRPYGNTERTGGTWDAQGGDAGKLGKPAEIQSDRNGPSDRSGKQ